MLYYKFMKIMQLICVVGFFMPVQFILLDFTIINCLYGIMVIKIWVT